MDKRKPPPCEQPHAHSLLLVLLRFLTFFTSGELCETCFAVLLVTIACPRSFGRSFLVVFLWSTFRHLLLLLSLLLLLLMLIRMTMLSFMRLYTLLRLLLLALFGSVCARCSPLQTLKLLFQSVNLLPGLLLSRFQLTDPTAEEIIDHFQLAHTGAEGVVLRYDRVVTLRCLEVVRAW